MHFQNRYEVENNVTKFRKHPVLHEAARYLLAFMEEVDAHSGGWHSWPLPVRAAHSLMLILEEGRADVTRKTYFRTLRPIKAFMTRRGDAAGMRRIFFLSDGRMILAHKSTFPDRDRPVVEDHYLKAVKPESKPATFKITLKDPDYSREGDLTPAVADALQTFLEYDEYLTVEIDPVKMTARVVPVRELES